MMGNTVKYISASTVIDAGGSPIDKEWLNIIPPDQYNPTDSNMISMMLAALASGGIPADISDAVCPVLITYDAAGNRDAMRYTAVVRINRAPSLQGNYNLTCENPNCTVSGPVLDQMDQYEEIQTKGADRIPLGWLPGDKSLKIVQVYPSWPDMDIKQLDGIIYTDKQLHALLFVSGIAVIDRWEITLNHDFSDDGALPSSVTVKAAWGQDRAETAEVPIPKCAGSKGEGEQVQINPKEPTRTIYYDKCRGQVLDIRYDGEGGG